MRHRGVKILIFIVLVALAALVVMLLWNSIVVSVIGLGALTYLQAAGLLILCRLLFGGVRPHRRHIDRGVREQLRGMSRQQKREYIRDYMSRGEDGK